MRLKSQVAGGDAPLGKTVARVCPVNARFSARGESQNDPRSRCFKCIRENSLLSLYTSLTSCGIQNIRQTHTRAKQHNARNSRNNQSCQRSIHSLISLRRDQFMLGKIILCPVSNSAWFPCCCSYWRPQAPKLGQGASSPYPPL